MKCTPSPPRLLRALALTVTGFLLAARPGFAQTLDTRFPVLNGPVTALTASGDTLYVGGSFSRYSGIASPANTVVSLVDGAPHPEFSVNGPVRAALDDGSGGVYIAGAFTIVNGQPRARLARLRPDLTLDPWNPAADGDVNTAVLADGVLWIGGAFTAVAGQPRARLAAFDSTGALTAWAPYANQTVLAMAARDGVVYVGGSFTSLGPARSRIGAITYDGSVTAWDPAANTTVRDLVVGDESVWAAGDFGTIGGQVNAKIARIDRVTGAADGWGAILSDFRSGLLPSLGLHDGALFVSGPFRLAHGQPRRNVAALDAQTGALLPWDAAADDDVLKVRVRGDVVLLIGRFKNLRGFARWSVGTVDANTGAILPWTCNANNQISEIAVADGFAWIGGSFGFVAGTVQRNLVAVSRTSGELLPWNPNPDGAVLALAVSEGRLYAGGKFRTLAETVHGNVGAVDLATGQATGFLSDTDDTVRALCVQGGTVYVGGDFSSAGGSVRTRLAAMDAATGALAPWNPGADGSVRSLDVASGTVYAGGHFLHAGGVSRRFAAAFDAGTGAAETWNPDAGFWVDVVRARGDAVYAGGLFNEIGGATRYFAAALDPFTGHAAAWDPNLGQGTMICLDVSTPTTYVGGNFVTLDGVPQRGLAAFGADGSLLTTWNATATGTVNAIVVRDGVVYAGGTSAFTAGGVSRNYLAAIQGSPVGAPLVAGADLAFRLGPVTPNPLRSTGSIRFDLPEDAVVRAALFDVAGRRVAELVNGVPFTAGAHELTLDRGALGSGVYFLRVEGSGLRAQTKVVMAQ